MAVTNDEIQDYVRFWLANLPESDISVEDFNKVIEITRVQYPEATDCQMYYYVAVAVLNWLIKLSGQSAGGSGQVSQIREKRGNTEKEVYYDTDSDTSSNWTTILDNLLSDPSTIGCNIDFSVPRVAVNIGGVRKNQVRSVKRDPVSNTVYDRRRINNKFRNRSCKRRTR